MENPRAGLPHAWLIAAHHGNAVALHDLKVLAADYRAVKVDSLDQETASDPRPSAGIAYRLGAR